MIRQAVFMAGALLASVLTTTARADTSCSYTQTKTGSPAAGLTLEQGSVTCQASGANWTDEANVFILRVDLKTSGRRIITTTPPVKPPSPAPNPDKYVGSIFELELPTHNVKKPAPDPKPIVHSKFVAQAAVDGNLSTNCCVYVRADASTQATWLRGLEIADGRVNNPVKGNSNKPCEHQNTGECFGFDFDASLLIDRNGTARIEKIDVSPASLSTIRTAVTGSHMLVDNGQVKADQQCAGGQRCSGEFFGPNSRTAVGLIDSDTMIVVAVDSKISTSQTGLQLNELATFLRNDLHMASAINLDGGGSTIMGVRRLIGGVIVNSPRDGAGGCDQPAPGGGCERYVGNALVIGVVE